VRSLAAAIKFRVGGQEGLVMVGLSMDAFIDARVDVLLAGNFFSTDSYTRGKCELTESK
jgi:hypothetical protein